MIRFIKQFYFFYLAGLSPFGSLIFEANPEIMGSQTYHQPYYQSKADDKKIILFLGNSLSAGYGLDPSFAFPALIGAKIDSLGWNFSIINAGLSGETTAGGSRRINWLLKNRIDILIIELGGNDGLRGISTEVSKNNLQVIIDKTKIKYPDVKIVLAGMQVPPNLGAEYTSQFRKIFPELAKKNNTLLISSLLVGVGGKPELNLPDGIHPTVQGHQIIAENVWKVLKPLLISMQ